MAVMAAQSVCAGPFGAKTSDVVAWQMLVEKDGEEGAVAVESMGQNPRIETPEEGARRFVYDGVMAQGRTFNVKVTVDERTTPNGTVYNGLVENNEPGLRVSRFIGPKLQRVGLDPDSASLYLPSGFGRRLRYFPTGDMPNGPWAKCAPFMYLELGGRPHGQKGDLIGAYPSCRMTMPWTALEAGDGTTYYAAVHDEKAAPKRVGFRWYPGEKNLDIRFWHHISVRTGEKWSLPETVFEKIRGDWHAAARRYRAWYDSVHAASRSIRAAAPAWTRDITGWLLVIMKQQNEELMWKYTDIPKLCDVAERNGLNCIGLFGWTVGGHDHLYPDYDPDPKMGGVEALKAGIAEAHRRGIKVCIYANGQLQQMGATDFWREHGERLAIRPRDGKPYFQTYHKYKDIPVYQFALGCLCGEAWFDRMLALAFQAESFGADAILYDQLGVTGPFECWGKDHGHPVPWHSYGEERPQYIRRLTDGVQAKNKEFSVFTEGLHDTILDSIGFFHSWIEGSFLHDAEGVYARARGAKIARAETFPGLIRYTFPEVVSSTRFSTPMAPRVMTNYAVVYGLRHEIEIRYMPDRTYVLDGKVPERADYGTVQGPPNLVEMHKTPQKEANAYLKAACEFQQKHAKYLMNGRFVDDEGFTCKGTGLVAKRFVAADGSSAVCVWNTGVQPVVPEITGLGTASEVFAPAGESAKGPLAPNSIRLYTFNH